MAAVEHLWAMNMSAVHCTFALASGRANLREGDGRTTFREGERELSLRLLFQWQVDSEGEGRRRTKLSQLRESFLGSVTSHEELREQLLRFPFAEAATCYQQGKNNNSSVPI